MGRRSGCCGAGPRTLNIDLIYGLPGYRVFEGGVLERIPAGPIWGRELQDFASNT
jgi:hypothetical protein